jgi:hypothetical protein
VSDPLYFGLEPILAWRAWVLDTSGSRPELSSIVYRTPWPAREPLRSTCEAGGCLAARWPAHRHTCGIHAFKERAGAEDFPSSWERLRFGPAAHDEYVIGRVSLWGHVVEHEAGYRAELAYPYELVLSLRHARYAHALASAYAVDVTVDPAL